MATLKLSHIIFTLFLYQIKIASSEILYLDNIVGSGFNIIKIIENRITRTMIYSTPDRQITQVRQGRKLIWMGYPGESIKCLTIFSFESSSKILITIEIENPAYDSLKFIYMHRNYFRYVTKAYFETNFAMQAKPLKSPTSKPIPGKLPIPRLKKPEKRKADAEKSKEAKKKIVGHPSETKTEAERQTQTELYTTTSQQTTQPQKQSEPEIIQVEVGSDDEGTDDFLVVSTSQKVDLYSETVDTTTGTAIHPKEQQVKILTQIRYTQTDTHESEDTETQTDTQQSKDTETQTVILTDSTETQTLIPTDSTDTQTDTHESKETETQTVIPTDSTETQTDTHETEDIGIQTKLRTRYPKKQHAVKTNSVQTQTEMVVPIGGEFDDEDSEGEIIPVLIGSDGEYEELPMFPGEEESDIEFQISSDSDMDIDESTDDHIIQSDAITQTDKQNDNRDPSTLPIKKRPYKPD
ncbi:TpHN family protein [Theileria parva strain Muguga]|uniref:TashAT3 protein, putative n=1 Tax=Theileria parva TaxID=5875 RepID=Q4N866_THEPA|nr:uncharacterized protein TpMuguga_01g00604 [Theileria parva strain Muguga]EAN33842.1 TpHN family protein [Theileria parva strain Muguga]|eukprot:XP_766125.1 hypothetical protein [Theileria parva strain Muguga]